MVPMDTSAGCRWRSRLALLAHCHAVVFDRRNLLLHGSASETVRAPDSCHRSLRPLGAGQRPLAVAVPEHCGGFPRHDLMAVASSGTSTSRTMSTSTAQRIVVQPASAPTTELELDAAIQTPAKAQLALLNQDPDELEAAIGEVNRERQVRERCYPRWTAEGKLSKIDAKDRLSRIIKAEEILQLVIDSRR